MPGARKSAKYIFFGNTFTRVITFAASIALARLLFPSDYGYLMMASVFSSFIGILANTGFENFYLQEKIENIQQKKMILSITVKLRLMMNIFMFILQFILSYPVQHYYESEIVGQLLRILSVGYIINAFYQVPLFVLRKKIDFRPEVYAGIAKGLVDSGTKVLFAYLGFGALSFAYGSILGGIVFMLIIIKKSNETFDLKLWDQELFHKIFYFGKHYLVTGIGSYLSSYMDKIILMNNFNPHALGLYNFAFSQSDNIRAKTSRPMGKLIISYIAKHKDDPEKIKNALWSMSYFELVFFTPIYIFLMFYADFIVVNIFGDKWLDAVPVIQVFLVYGLITSIYGASINILTGIGYPEIQSKLSLANLVVLIPVLLLISFLKGSIIDYAITYVVITILYSVIKSGIGIIKLGYNPFVFFTSLKLGIFVIQNIIFSVSIALIISIFDKSMVGFILAGILMLLLFILFHLVIYRQYFFKSFSFLVNKEHKIYKLLTKISNILLQKGKI
ncbi:oligosaccharide flippase family protein [Sulfurovum sp.]|uniref:oligosaccharide flippase family protein n=1 Tax=Sulfurovum sp. TaxID=1969726 RepID=UPI0025FBA746|nr:oligosaccharide flippase family protein [Sulfurovum sp.]